MNLETTFKYFEFVASECDRHLEDGRVTDDELNQLIIEFRRFQEESSNSDLPQQVKSWIREIEFNYTPKKLKRSFLFMVLTLLTIGSWAYLIEVRRQSLRKSTLEKLGNTVRSLSYKVKIEF